MQPASFAMLLILGRRDPASLTSLAREEMRTIDADLTIGVGRRSGLRQAALERPVPDGDARPDPLTAIVSLLFIVSMSGCR